MISGSYAGDLDGNGIHDALEAPAGPRNGIVLASAEPQMARVELVFQEPVTQQQIDAFLRLGGQITYLYRAISYGWTGRIPRASIPALPVALGPTLVRVEPIRRLEGYLDMATRTGRIRPVWRSGFAGSSIGFAGDPNTTIGFLGSGLDGTHADLRGRGVYWRDFSDDNEPAPVDYDGHESAVAGVALGTGAAGGANTRPLYFTYANGSASKSHSAFPIALAAGVVTVTSTAWWTGPSSSLIHYGRPTGSATINPVMLGISVLGLTPQTLTNTISASNGDLLVVTLRNTQGKTLTDAVVTTVLSSYPGVGDGFNKFRGVAPGCQWAAAKIVDQEGNMNSEGFTAALDDLVLQRQRLHLKVLNISIGLQDDLGFPEESTALRDKVNSVVRNGIIVVAAAGNGATKSAASWRGMADPARAAQALTVGAANDNNGLTDYSNSGFPNPRPEQGEDFKPDVLAPGGSSYWTGVLSVDSGTADCRGADREPNDYTCGAGTSFAAPFVAGSAALVIQALEHQGVPWRFDSADQPRYIKMLLCATASETNAAREGTDRSLDPTLSRAAAGPNGFPRGKDPQEGYGIINPDAAIEAVSQTYLANSTLSSDLGPDALAKRVWARTMSLTGGRRLDLTLTNPASADFDLYLYTTVPSDTGTPVILASSTQAGAGLSESLHYTPDANQTALVVVKRVSGGGTFTLTSTQAGPPLALNAQAGWDATGPLTITLPAFDDGGPGPIRGTILSLPARGRLELVDGTLIAGVPTKAAQRSIAYQIR